MQRAFVVFVQNTTTTTRSFRMSIVNQPPGGRASFRQFDVSATGTDIGPLTSIIVTTPARSTAARSVYATSSNASAQIQVDVVEVPYGGTVPAVPLADQIILNPDIANPDIANPDIANLDIANPDMANASLTDVTWTMTNNGNTTAAFNVNLFLAQQTDKICAPGADPNAAGCIAT